MVNFHSYVKLPEGVYIYNHWTPLTHHVSGKKWNSHLFPAFGGFPSRGAGSSAKGFPPDRTCINGKIHGIMDFDLQNDGEMRMTTWYLKYLEVDETELELSRSPFGCKSDDASTTHLWQSYPPGFSHGRRCLLPKKKGTAHRAPVTQPQPSAHLVGGIPTPLEKYESQLGSLFPIDGKS